MAKQLLVSVMEDIVGEYILNISKDNLKIAALRGKVKLENVQLDGDLIGSHVLGAVGLSGFGVLSCWAKSLKISVPLKNLEKQPTRFEIQGIHLLCVPLLPSTAHRTYGAGTAVDPRCSLRTRAKRSSLARLERNFFQGRIPGEGPPTRRVRNAIKRAASNLRKSKAKWKSKRFNSDNISDNDSFSEKGDSSLSDLSNEVPDSLFMPSNNSWAVKLREKVLRNLEISISNMHVRCEISQGGLDFIHPGQIHFQQGSGVHEHLTPEQRAFAFGLTLDSFIIRTPTQEDTCHNASAEKSDENATVISNPKNKANISPITSGEIKYKLAEINNLSFYWDDDPPLILSDSHLLVTNEQNLSPTRVLTRLAAAMEVMADFQDPGDLILLSLSKPEVSSPTRKTTNKHKDPSKSHTYCFENFCAQMKMELGDRNQPGPIKLLAEFLPVKFPLQFRSYQFIQYQKLKSAMFSQQRFDTMLRQRPNGDPISQPRQWWKYLIACVTTSPHSRPWEDVAKITKCRARYVELVKKKITSSSEGSGFHSGLKDEESFELLSLEDLLPIEALQTFHLIALREVYEDTKRVEKVSLEEMGSDEVEFAVKSSSRPRLLNPFRRTKKSVDQGKDADDEVVPKKSSIGGLDSIAVVAAINSRMGRKSWINTFILNEVNISLVLIQGNERLIQVELQATGEIKTLGPGRFDLLFDIIRFEIIDPQKRLVHFIQYQTIDCGKLLMFEAHRDMFQGDLSLSMDSSLSLGRDQAMELPPIGVVCRLSANKETNSLKLGISALPATLVWSKPCMDAVLEFFSSPSTELQTEVSRQLRNVATPLARKAILALMSPNEFQINMNVAAPKVWFPISLEADDGAVHFDAGKFIMSISKKELLTDTFWNFCARDIQVMFVRQKESISATSRKECITIVKPLQVQVEAIMAEHKIEKPAKNPAFYALNATPDDGPWRKLDIFVSSICLNLVDAEILARAIGKWYASGLVKVRKLKEKKSFASVEKGFTKKQGDEAILQGSKFTSTGVSFLSVHIERIQMALEGHSKSEVHVANGKESHVGSNGSEPRTRTYVVDLVDISIGRLSQKSISKSQFLISDISIFRADCDTRLDYKMVPTYNAHTIPHCILIRLDKEESSSREASSAAAALNLSPPRLNAKQSPSPKSPSGPIEIGGVQKGNVTSFLSVRLFHDRLLHLDEVEIGMNSVVLRITPTTLKDCSKGFRKVMELIQIVTQEMERYVHEGGRKARQAKLVDRSQKATLDSSILFRVTLHEMTLLAGHPLSVMEKYRQEGNGSANISFAVVQVVANSLLMFQSVENSNGSGSKTLHVSVDNLSASANTEFYRLPAKLAPMIGPTATDFRVVYSTENLGSVVSQDFSLDCEALKASFTPNDLLLIASVVDTIYERLQRFGRLDSTLLREYDPTRQPMSSFVRYQKKGAGIATSIRFEIQLLSVILLEPYQSKQGTRPLFDVRFNDLKGRLRGCLTAISGDCNTSVSINHFNFDLGEWESTIEHTELHLTLERMPNEMAIRINTTQNIAANISSVMLRDYIKAHLSFNRSKSEPHSRSPFRAVTIDPSTLSTIGLRRATEGHAVLLQNDTGIDFLISASESDQSYYNLNCDIYIDQLVEAGTQQALIASITSDRNSGLPSGFIPKLKLQLTPSAVSQIGDREPLIDLPIFSADGQCISLHRLQPTFGKDRNEPLRIPVSGRCSPDTVLSENSRLTQAEYAYYNAEPVVEWCMQNQRLRTNVADSYSLPKGRDLLSSQIWSPGDDRIVDIDQGLFVEAIGHSESTDDTESLVLPRKAKAITIRPSQQSNWVKPYLKNDSPEWTDMTCILRMARERVMLPDNNWIWLNDWTVDVSGAYGESTDCEGWEYEADFETFNRNRRFYKRGDSCRRRRWTRTRMIRPPPLSDPQRPIFLVWETSRNSSDNFVIQVRSHVTLHNYTTVDFAVFVSSPSWDESGLGMMNAGLSFPLPIKYANATYVQLGIPRDSKSKRYPSQKKNMSLSRRFMIVPTGNTSSNWIRTVINVRRTVGSEVFMGLDVDRNVHVIIEVSSVKGVVDVYVHPVLRVVNLLPCQIECELGEISEDGADEVRRVIGPKGRKILSKEHLVIQVGADAKAVGVNPCLKPHISLRLPGYHWSSWHRIVNRLQGSNTWQPIDEEEDWHLNSAKSDSDNADEFKSIVYFERRGAGDPLNLIISVEMGHCPTIRVFAQFWILDKTGFGCRFCDSFSDLLGASPDTETLRRSYLPEAEVHTTLFKEEMSIPGHQWAVGKDGMTLFFSRKEKFALSIEHRRRSVETKKQSAVKSNWVSPMDVSNVIPKTVFSVDEYNGSRKFELAVSVNVCPSIFSRTTLITLYPRYQIVNLLKEVLVVAQDGWQNVQTYIPPNSSVSFHWERKALPPKVRLGHAIGGKKSNILWSNGCIQLDKVGITSMRIPISASDSNNPVVVQAEVRLATKEQSSAVVVVIWTTDNNSNSLYLLRNDTTKTIICRQPLHDLEEIEDGNKVLPSCSGQAVSGGAQGFECGADFGPIINAVFGLETKEEFIWVLHPGENISFGFDDPEKGHILEWNCVSNESNDFLKNSANAFVEIDAMGSLSVLPLGNGSEIRCQIGAEHSTKVIEFVEHVNHKGSLNKGNMKKLRRGGKHYEDMLRSNFPDNKFRTIDDEENGYFSIQLSFPGISISIIDNQSSLCYGREIMMAQLDNLMITFAQNLEGYHEMELILYSLQVDNHVKNSIHPVLVFCPKPDIDEPLVHMSAIRRMQAQSKSLAFRYVAIRILDIEIYLDRRTAENVASFIQPLGETQEDQHQDPKAWITDVTQKMEVFHQRGIESTSADVDAIASTANRSRIYIEQLHLHPVRIGLTFTQEWMEWSSGAEGMMIFQFIRGMASIANAPLKFTSFVVCHVFESPESLGRIVAMHYSSQLTKQIFGILGSLVILGAPADFISNVGTGVRDFFYEPINGLVHGPAQFFEGLEAGTQSLARGVFVGVVRGAANVTEVVNSNLAGLTADDQFLDERKAHQRMLTDALSRGEKRRDFQDSLQLACASVARGVRSGAFGIWEQPILYASKHGPIGFVKGIGKALVGAIVKPVVGVGDAAVLVMNHVSDATSDKQIIPKIPKRLRRALPRASREKLFNVRLVPYDDRAAKAQKIVTGGESLDDVYIGHISIPTHLIIASDQYLLALDKRSREPWRVSWEEISHFAMQDRDKMRITVFGHNGLKSFVFEVNDADDCELFYNLLLMQADKTGNGASISPGNKHDLLHADLEDISKYDIPGIKARQATHVFGRVNNSRKRLSSNTKDEIDVIEQCFSRVRNLSSHSREFLKSLDHEAWGLIDSWGQVFSGLSSRRCIAVSMINGTGFDIQLKSTKLVEGGSPCYSIPTQEFDTEQGVLRPGGVIIFFGWGVVPNLLQAGNVFMTIETNAFVSDLSGCQGRETYIETMPGYEVGFLEKSYDESGWWAKYWLLVKKG